MTNDLDISWRDNYHLWNIYPQQFPWSPLAYLWD